MDRKLFVGGLPYETTEDELNEAFAEYGNVEEAIIIKDRETGRSKGFGFVTMSTEEEAKAAMEAWNGKEFGGRTLKVDVAISKQ